MTGEVKVARSKRCLSRNKRSKPEKLTENDHDSDEATCTSGRYTAVRSKQSALIHSDDESTDNTSGISDNCVEGALIAGSSRDHESDAYDFCDDEAVVEESRSVSESGSNTCKRKRIDSEELEPSGFTTVVSKFKKSRNALNNLKQPSICLEDCKEVSVVSKCGRNRTDTCVSERNKKGTVTKALSLTEASLHQLHGEDIIADDASSTVNDQKQNQNPENHKVDNVHERKTDGETKPLDNSEDSSRNQVCPVCNFKFLPKDETDMINEHINSCLDRGCDGSSKDKVLLDAISESIGEDMFFCQLCQKDLSRMNSQRRQQHVNRCCDQACKAEEMLRLSTVQSQPQCPICGKGFKSSKSRHSHLKKCAQEFNVGTNRLLEIVHREKRQEESTSSAVTTEANTVLSTNVQPARNSTGVKRKRRGAKNECDFDEETQLAMALSASMAPPQLPAPPVRRGGKGRGKKNLGGSELPALLLRDDETAQRAVALRAAQVLCTQEGNDEDDEISCTPALAPSRLAQNIPACQPVDVISEEMESKDFVDGVLVDSEVDSTAKSGHEMEEDNLMGIHSGNESEEESRKSVGVTSVVDPLLSRSFLNFLYDVEFEESQPTEMKPPQTSHLWSLAAAKDESSIMFYVPGLLPPVSPRQQKRPNKFTLSESSAKESLVQKKLHEQVDDNEETKKVPSHTASEKTPLQVTTTENDESPEMTPSQAANVEMLLELAGGDDISNVSMNSQQMITASGFCIDEQEEEDMESITVPSGVSNLLQDLSSMINNPYLSDVIIYLKDGHELAAHSFILSLRSDVLAQLLKERKALQEKSMSGGSLDRVSLNFEEVDRSAFEVVLKHIYTGDVIIPEQCQLDDVTSLADRFKLPCLLTACKKTQLRLKQALESVDDDEMDDFIATDVAQVEQDVWKSDNDDDTSEHAQTTNNKDDEDGDDFLNDDDIEEIMIFQTQSLQRKGSEKGVDEKEHEKSKHLPSVDTEEEVISTGLTCNQIPSKFVDDVSGAKLSFLSMEETEQNLQKRLEDDVLSRCPVGEGTLLGNPWEKGNLSCSPVEDRNVSHNLLEKGDLPVSPVVVGNVSSNPLGNDDLLDSHVLEQSLSRNRVEESNPSRNPHGNGGNLAEEEQRVSCPKEQLVEDVIITNEQLPLKEESASKKQLRNKKDYYKGNQSLSCDDNVKSCASSIERARVQEGEPISDSDGVEAQPEDHMQESSEGRTVKRDLEKSYDVVKDVPHVEGTAEVDFELQNDADYPHIYNVTADLLNADNQVEYGDLKEENVSEKIQDNVRDSNPDKNRGSSKRLLDEPISPPPGDGRWDVEDVFQGSPGEVTVAYDAESVEEMEEMALNESITLISDHEEEVLDVSPPKTDITIVPETPHVRGRISTKSSSTLSVSEEDDVSVTGSSPSKSRKELNKEANEFLSKLKQRAERGKGKKQSKKTAKKNCGAKRSPAEIPPKQTTPTKRSPVRNRETQMGTSPLSSPQHSNPPAASPLQMSPSGTKSSGLSPTPWMSPGVCNSPSDVTTQTSRVCKSPIGSLMQTSPGDCKSPRGFNPRRVSPVAVVTIGNSPPVSPDLHLNDSPLNSQTRGKELEKVMDFYVRNSLGGKDFDYGEPNDVEIVETCADKTEGGICGNVALSPSSSAPEVMSPPVPSPSYSFLDHVSSPGSPVPYTSPPPEKSVSLSDPVSPSSLGWNSPASEKKLDARAQPNSPVSPSVCSYRPQIPRNLCSQVSRKDAVKNLDFERSLNDKEKPRNAEVVEIDPNIPLMERLKAARGAKLKIFSLGKDEDDCDTNSDNCARNEVNPSENNSPISVQREKVASSPLEMNASVSAEFDFYDDSGFNIDLYELNNLEGGMEDGDIVITNKESHSKDGSNEGKVTAQKKGSKQVAGKREIPLSQRRGQDCDSPQPPSKRGKKTATHSSKPTGQTVAQPVTPMPNYNEMATPVLKTELHKFGVRPLAKKKMILKLKEIYDYTHQVEPGPQESKTERAPSKGQPLPSNVVVSDTTDGVEGSGTASSDNSDEEDTEFGDCTVMIEDDVITASQQVNGGNLKERLVHYFRNNEELYKNVLRYQPQELVSLQQQIKSDGINCPLGKLVDFLDQQCVTFTTAGSRTRAPKKRGRKKKGDYVKPS